MRYAVSILFALSLIGCGVSINGAIPAPPNVVNGKVSSVQVSSVASSGSFIQVTFVTLQTSGFSNQLAFCGDAASQFPMHTSVTVNFNPGQNCNQIIVVVVG